MDVSIKNLEPMTVASARHTGPYAECEKAWKTLCASPEVCKTFGPNTKFFGMCYDDPKTTPPEEIRYDACVTIDGPGDFGSEVVVQTIEAGPYAAYVHKGSYDGLMEVYTKLYREWLPASGHEAAAKPCLEFYLNHPEQTPPEELLTEICIPLKS
ncbi:MAG: GyrI-like domain-containing protein [Planctomycetia bacterium]|jgi:AraC family transcriptional regulator